MFQGLDALPGIKGEKGILGFPGPRVRNNEVIDRYQSDSKWN